ncbi:hypothetical protein C8R44DRAFT_845143 [Mycena epipterygia]|nr:hypothetical protein C8R44DRAFT_845143 [Mycena epipterygia]
MPPLPQRREGDEIYLDASPLLLPPASITTCRLGDDARTPPHPTLDAHPPEREPLGPRKRQTSRDWIRRQWSAACAQAGIPRNIAGARTHAGFATPPGRRALAPSQVLFAARRVGAGYGGDWAFHVARDLEEEAQTYASHRARLILRFPGGEKRDGLKNAGGEGG